MFLYVVYFQTIADLALLHELNGPQLFGLYDFSAYPLIASWLQNMSKRPISLELIKPLEMAKSVLLNTQQGNKSNSPTNSASSSTN